MPRYAAFISYAHRYRDWVTALHRNLERCLEFAGETDSVFLDRADLDSGRSWVGQLQTGIDHAEHLVLVATPESLASSRVADEWSSFIAERRDWQRGHLHVALLVDTPLPSVLDGVQRVDFREHDDAAYRHALKRLAGGILGRGPRELPELPPDIEIPPFPSTTLPPELRARLVDWLTPLIRRKIYRPALASVLGLERSVLEGHPSAASAASAAIALATGDDDPLAAARRIAEALAEFFDEEPTRLAELHQLLEALPAERRDSEASGLVGSWLRNVVSDHERLVPYFEERGKLDLLDPVYVQLELRYRGRIEDHDSVTNRLQLGRPLTLRELLDLDPSQHPWVTRRWMVVGDPGSGKTTLLRHLAATVARASPPLWLPIFESLSRLMREPEWLLDRIERRMKRAGEPAKGLAAVLDRAGHEGRLLVLLDGLDEVSRDRREEAETLLHRFSQRWPQTPVVGSKSSSRKIPPGRR